MRLYDRQPGTLSSSLTDTEPSEILSGSSRRVRESYLGVPIRANAIWDSVFSETIGPALAGLGIQVASILTAWTRQASDLIQTI